MPECEPLLSSTTGEIAFGSEQGQSGKEWKSGKHGLSDAWKRAVMIFSSFL